MSESIGLGEEILTPRLIKITYHRLPIDTLIKVTKSRDLMPILNYLRSTSSLDYKECGWAISLTSSSHVIGLTKISEGTHSSTFLFKREIIQIALMTHATAMIIIHNHPSGDVEPSPVDLATTKSMQQSFKLFDLKLLDHIILSTESHFSMADEGLLLS